MLRFKCLKCLQSLCKICKMDKPITINLIMIYSHPSSRRQVTLSWATVIYLSKLHQAFNWLILNLWWATNFKNFVKWIKIAQMEMRRPWYRVRMTWVHAKKQIKIMNKTRETSPSSVIMPQKFLPSWTPLRVSFPSNSRTVSRRWLHNRIWYRTRNSLLMSATLTIICKYIEKSYFFL